MSGSIYINGRILILRHIDKYSLVRLSPYEVYSINEEACKILKLIDDCSQLDYLYSSLQANDELRKDKINKFIKMSIKSNILTLDINRKGKLGIKQANTTPFLERLFIELTDACNLNCEHCYMSSSYTNRKINMLPLDLLDDLMQKAEKLGVYRVDFTGGELFVRNDIKDILKISADHFMVSNIFTNGTLLNEKNVALLKENGNIRSVFISLDDIIPEEHDSFRGVKGSFKRTVEGIKQLKNSNLKIVANITLNRRNVGRIQDIINFCREDLEIECRTAPVLYLGKGKCFEDKELTMADIIGAMKISLKNKVQFTSGYCDTEDNDSIIPGCGVGHKMLYIRSNGEICLCPTLSSREDESFLLGNIYQDDINAVWENSKALQLFRASNCDNTECKNIMICRGGCRSRAFLQRGDLCDKDLILCKYFEDNKIIMEAK